MGRWWKNAVELKGNGDKWWDLVGCRSNCGWFRCVSIWASQNCKMWGVSPVSSIFGQTMILKIHGKIETHGRSSCNMRWNMRHRAAISRGFQSMATLLRPYAQSWTIGLCIPRLGDPQIPALGCIKCFSTNTRKWTTRVGWHSPGLTLALAVFCLRKSIIRYVWFIIWSMMYVCMYDYIHNINNICVLVMCLLMCLVNYLLYTII